MRAWLRRESKSNLYNEVLQAFGVSPSLWPCHLAHSFLFYIPSLALGYFGPKPWTCSCWTKSLECSTLPALQEDELSEPLVTVVVSDLTNGSKINLFPESRSGLWADSTVGTIFVLYHGRNLRKRHLSYFMKLLIVYLYFCINNSFKKLAVLISVTLLMIITLFFSITTLKTHSFFIYQNLLQSAARDAQIN